MLVDDFIRRNVYRSLKLVRKSENAENVLQHAPEERRSSATTNLLNLCDGLLADVLNVTVIATFNCNHSAIDPALLRPGRLKFKWNSKVNRRSI